MLKHTENKLRALGVLGNVDRKRLAEIVGAAQGIPVSVLMK